SPTDVLHCHSRNQRRLAGLADLRFRHPDAAERRIAIQRISSDPITHASLLTIQDVCRYNLEIVPRCVRKRASTVAVSHRPDTRHVGTQLIVYSNISVLIGSDTGLVQAKIVRVRPPTNRYQNVRPDDL